MQFPSPWKAISYWSECNLLNVTGVSTNILKVRLINCYKVKEKISI